MNCDSCYPTTKLWKHSFSQSCYGAWEKKKEIKRSSSPKSLEVVDRNKMSGFAYQQEQRGQIRSKQRKVNNVKLGRGDTNKRNDTRRSKDSQGKLDQREKAISRNRKETKKSRFQQQSVEKN